MSKQGIGNVLLTDDIIAKEALRLLKNNLVATRNVNRSYERVFGKVGDTISLKKPFRTKIADGRTLTKQPMVDQTIPFQINNHKHFGLEITQRDRTLSLQNFSDRYLKSGIVQLANAIDKSIFDAAMSKGFFSTIVAGSAIGTKDFLVAKARQNMVAVPDDGQRYGYLNPLDAADISDATSKVFNEQIVSESIKKGYMGPLGGYEIYESNNISSYTVGAGWEGTVKVATSSAKTGDTLTLEGFANAGTALIKKGDMFTIAGVYAINPVTRQSTGFLQTFVVTADADITGTTTKSATVKISPSINDGTLSTTDTEGTTISLAAYQNVSAAPANNAVVTTIGTFGTTYRQNFLWHKDAIALAMVDLELPQSAVVKARVRDDDAGLSMSMTGAYDINNHTEITRIDVVWGVDVIYPELLHRLISI